MDDHERIPAQVIHPNVGLRKLSTNLHNQLIPFRVQEGKKNRHSRAGGNPSATEQAHRIKEASLDSRLRGNDEVFEVEMELPCWLSKMCCEAVTFVLSLTAGTLGGRANHGASVLVQGRASNPPLRHQSCAALRFFCGGLKTTISIACCLSII